MKLYLITLRGVVALAILPELHALPMPVIEEIAPKYSGVKVVYSSSAYGTGGPSAGQVMKIFGIVGEHNSPICLIFD